MDELNSALGDAFHELGIVTLDETTVEVPTHPMPTRVRVDGIHVDIIPYGPGLAPDGILEPIAGVTLDITGLRRLRLVQKRSRLRASQLVSQH